MKQLIFAQRESTMLTIKVKPSPLVPTKAKAFIDWAAEPVYAFLYQAVTTIMKAGQSNNTQTDRVECERAEQPIEVLFAGVQSGELVLA